MKHYIQQDSLRLYLVMRVDTLLRNPIRSFAIWSCMSIKIQTNVIHATLHAMARSSYLKKHTKTHSRERPYNCKRCDKKFKTAFNLKRHEIIHITGNQFGHKASRILVIVVITRQTNWIKYGITCDQCEYKASQKSNLKAHIKRKHEHKGIVFPCEKCGLKASSKNALRDHKAYKHEGQTFRCEECDYKSTTKSNLLVQRQNTME